MPVEPSPSAFSFPSPSAADQDGFLVMGADLEPGTVLAAYRSGLFPMGSEPTWWSPDPRAILPVGGFHISRSLGRSRRRFEVTVDAAFEAVIDGCANRGADEGDWITPEIRAAYIQLYELGWAHSIEAWTVRPRELAGGLYGVSLGGLFAGESMFHRRTDASKAALATLVELVGAGTSPAARLIDVQWSSPHLASLGAVEIARDDYLARLERALALPLPPAFSGSS